MHVDLNGIPMAVVQTGPHHDEAGIELIWAHGWGQSGQALWPMAQAFASDHPSWVLDLPGFGASAQPPAHWGTADYADGLAAWLESLPARRRVWVGHSFGCRVGLQLAARHPDLLAGLVLVAAAGLPRRRSLWQKAVLKTRIAAFKLARFLVRSEAGQAQLRARFGSPDARASGALRGVFVRAVNENLATVAAQVRCPTLLIYGNDDRDTPPEIGQRLHQLIAHSSLCVLKGLDHYTVLGLGRHQVVKEIRRFVAEQS